MKKQLLLAIALFASVAAFSQNYKPFRVGLGLGYAAPQGDGAKGGVLFYGEPSYRISDAIALGFRLEAAIMLRGTTFVTAGNTSSASGSYTVNGQFYFTDHGFRPFIGAGAGLYSLASAEFTATSTGNNNSSSTSDAVSGGTKFGFYPRIGFDAGHFTLNIEYNIIGKSTNSFSYTSSNGTLATGSSETKNNYLGVKAGFFIGGGRR